MISATNGRPGMPKTFVYTLKSVSSSGTERMSMPPVST